MKLGTFTTIDEYIYLTAIYLSNTPRY